MRKKILSMVLAITMIGTPVYGAEFSDGENAEQVQTEAAENSNEENQMEPGDISDIEEVESEETQELDIVDNGDSADIEETATKDEELFFDSGEDTGKAEASETESIGYSKSAYVVDVSIISEPKKKKYYYGVYGRDIDFSGMSIEIHYSDETKETLKFARYSDIKKDSRGNSFQLIGDFEEDDYLETGSYEIWVDQVDGFSFGSVEINVIDWLDHSNTVSEPTKKKYDYGITVADIDLTGLGVEIYYTDKTKETLKFTRIDETIKDSRGHSYRSKLIKYTEDSDYYNTVEDIDSLGTYQVVIENNDNELNEWYEVIRSAKINVVVPSNVISLQKSGNDVFSRKVSAGKFVKFIPEKSGKYLITEDGSDSRPYLLDSEFNGIDGANGWMYVYESMYDLKKGCTYYVKASKDTTFTAELVPAIKSIQLESNFQKVIYYTPVNFETGEKNKYSIVPSPWLGKKLKITYENGTTESVGVYKSNRFYGRNNAYIVYSGKQSVPGAGTYDVHFELGGKEVVLKNGIQVKNLSQMPVIAGKGTKEMSVTGSPVYACLKTTSATSYTIKCEPQTHPYLTVSQLKNGKLEQVLTVENGKKCTLKPNSVYYIGMSLHSYVRDIDKVKFTVTQSSQKTQISKTKITIGTLSYTGSNVKPAVTVKNGSKTLRQGTDYIISYTKAKKVGATVKITITGKGSYTGKIVKTAYIIPSKITLSAVKAGKKNITVTYKKVTGASGYQIAYSTKKSSGYKYLNLNSKTYKKTITRLTSGKKYYVRVRAYKTINNKKCYGSFSSIKTVKVK